MKYRLRSALTAVSVALGSTLALAQGETQQGGGQTDSSSAMTWPGGAGTLEQFANARPDALDGQELVNAANERIGTLEDVVRNTEDSEIYALISTEDALTSAVKLSELSVGAIVYEGSPSDLENDVYNAEEYVRVSADVPAVNGGGNDGGSDNDAPTGAAATAIDQAGAGIARATAGQRTPGALVGNAEPGLAIDDPFVEQLARNATGRLEGTPLIGNDGAEIGQIDHIARNPDGELVAVVTVPESGLRSVVDLADLALGRISYDGNVEDLRNQDFDNDAYQPVTIPQ